jgi:hypothetical protein
MIGTDYSHADQSAEIQALDVIEERGEKGKIPASVARKILDDNPRRFYRRSSGRFSDSNPLRRADQIPGG